MVEVVSSGEKKVGNRHHPVLLSLCFSQALGLLESAPVSASYAQPRFPLFSTGDLFSHGSDP